MRAADGRSGPRMSWPSPGPSRRVQARRATPRVAVAALILLTFAAGVVATTPSTPYAQASDRAFRIEWQRSESARGPCMTGYVYNDAGLAAARVSLFVEALDGAGRP